MKKGSFNLEQKEKVKNMASIQSNIFALKIYVMIFVFILWEHNVSKML